MYDFCLLRLNVCFVSHMVILGGGSTCTRENVCSALAGWGPLGPPGPQPGPVSSRILCLVALVMLADGASVSPAAGVVHSCSLQPCRRLLPAFRALRLIAHVLIIIVSFWCIELLSLYNVLLCLSQHFDVLCPKLCCFPLTWSVFFSPLAVSLILFLCLK